MIVRFKVKNFKNLQNVEIPFGPFTCIAGMNAVGKSNLFDAIRFLSALAGKDNTLVEAAFSIRDEKNKKRTIQDLRSLFFHDGENYASTIEFEVQMLIPKTGIDHLGQSCTATTTALKYSLEIGYHENAIERQQSALYIIREDLVPMNKQVIKPLLKQLGGNKRWIDSVVVGTRRNSTPFIQTLPGENIVTVSQDQVQGGSKRRLRLDSLPRTVLSSANAVETPTMLLVKLEMESWRLIQFEPSALRSSDELVFTDLPQVSTNGEHLPAALFRLINDKKIHYDVRAHLGLRLSELLDDVHDITVEKDEKRDILTLMVKGKNQVYLPSRSLSDGTLRFIALSLMEADPQVRGVICMEEPENGIHPARISAILKLLQDIATDIGEPVDQENPLRQVIINTHSPIVVAEIPDSSLFFAEFNSKQDRTVAFRPLSGTWQAKTFPNTRPIRKQDLVRYLSPVSVEPSLDNPTNGQPRKVKARPEVAKIFSQLSLFPEQ